MIAVVAIMASGYRTIDPILSNQERDNCIRTAALLGLLCIRWDNCSAPADCRQQGVLPLRLLDGTIHGGRNQDKEHFQVAVAVPGP